MKTHWCLAAANLQPAPHLAHLQLPAASNAATRASSMLIIITKLLLVLCILTILLNNGLKAAVVYQVRFISTKSGRLDYAIEGETVELSCHYIMKDEAEDVKQLVWSKDGKNFLRWRKNKPGLEVLSYTFKGHVDPNSTYSHINLRNVTLDMHGRYKCLVKTDLGNYEAEENFVVISQSHCRLNDWRVISQPQQCRELIRLDCRNMFPKPVPSCGLWNSKLEKFIRSVTVDISEEPQRQQTYRVKYADRFDLLTASASNSSQMTTNELLALNGHLMFKCDISVPETSWRMSFMYRMFNHNDGCHQDPLETIERMRVNYSHYATARMQEAGYLLGNQLSDIEMLTSNLKYELESSSRSSSPHRVALNCWQKPKLGTKARLSCITKSQQVRLTGASLLECQRSGWVPIMESEAEVPSKRPRPSRTPDSKAQVEVESSTTLATFMGRENDQDDNDSSSNDLEETITTTTTSITTTEFETIPPIDVLQHVLLSSSTDNYQLAALLPTCVSTKRYHQLASHSIVSNRLPLLDESLQHLNGGKNRHLSADNNHPDTHQHQNRFQGGSIFNIFSSSSGSQPLIPTFTLMLTLLVCSINYLHHRLFSNNWQRMVATDVSVTKL